MMDMIPDPDPLAEYLHSRLAPLASRDWPTIAEAVRAFLAERVTREKVKMALIALCDWRDDGSGEPRANIGRQKVNEMTDAILALLRRETGGA